MGTVKPHIVIIKKPCVYDKNEIILYVVRTEQQESLRVKNIDIIYMDNFECQQK